jgi:phage portal protein BeeE
VPTEQELPVHRRHQSRHHLAAGARARRVGLAHQWRKGDGNSAVYACLQAIATAIAEPELVVYKLQPGERVEQERTPLGELLRRPNPHMSMDTLLSYLSNCLHVDGNAYWRKLRAGNPETGNVVELWPICPTRIEPRRCQATSSASTATTWGPGSTRTSSPRTSSTSGPASTTATTAWDVRR